jgi:hypothetical protein
VVRKPPGSFGPDVSPQYEFQLIARPRDPSENFLLLRLQRICFVWCSVGLVDLPASWSHSGGRNRHNKTRHAASTSAVDARARLQAPPKPLHPLPNPCTHCKTAPPGDPDLTEWVTEPFAPFLPAPAFAGRAGRAKIAPAAIAARDPSALGASAGLTGWRDPFVVATPAAADPHFYAIVGAGRRGEAGTALVYRSLSIHSGGSAAGQRRDSRPGRGTRPSAPSAPADRGRWQLAWKACSGSPLVSRPLFSSMPSATLPASTAGPRADLPPPSTTPNRLGVLPRALLRPNLPHV